VQAGAEKISRGTGLTHGSRIKLPDAIAPRVPVKEIDHVGAKEPGGDRIEPHYQDKQQQDERAVNEAEKIGVLEIAAAKKEVIPESINEHNRSQECQGIRATGRR
jgi:hypothetical protein